MVKKYSATFNATLPELHVMLTWACEQLRDSGLTQTTMKQVEIALEETLVNIIYYAYQDQQGLIQMTCEIYPKRYIEFKVQDQGMPFNPLTQTTGINPYAPLEERLQGGLGISFIQELMDQISYKREGQTNCLILRKNCP